MGLFLFLTVVQAIVAFVLVILVLMQRSEGGGLGMGGGGSPGGVMSARGAADFLTRATKWAAVLFVGLAIVLAGVAVDASGTRAIDDTLDRTVTEPAGGAAAAGAAQGTATVAPADPAASGAPAQVPAPADDPLAGVSE